MGEDLRDRLGVVLLVDFFAGRRGVIEEGKSEFILYFV
jgi:hypothetical protein